MSKWIRQDTRSRNLLKVRQGLLQTYCDSDDPLWQLGALLKEDFFALTEDEIVKKWEEAARNSKTQKEKRRSGATATAGPTSPQQREEMEDWSEDEGEALDPPPHDAQTAEHPDDFLSPPSPRFGYSSTDLSSPTDGFRTLQEDEVPEVDRPLAPTAFPSLGDHASAEVWHAPRPAGLNSAPDLPFSSGRGKRPFVELVSAIPSSGDTPADEDLLIPSKRPRLLGP